jgi:hypothetical protein
MIHTRALQVYCCVDDADCWFSYANSNFNRSTKNMVNTVEILGKIHLCWF